MTALAVSGVCGGVLIGAPVVLIVPAVLMVVFRRCLDAIRLRSFGVPVSHSNPSGVPNGGGFARACQDTAVQVGC